MALVRAGGRRHQIRRTHRDEYEISWQYQVKYSGARTLHHHSITRDTNRKGAERFAKKHNVSFEFPPIDEDS